MERGGGVREREERGGEGVVAARLGARAGGRMAHPPLSPSRSSPCLNETGLAMAAVSFRDRADTRTDEGAQARARAARTAAAERIRLCGRRRRV